MPHILIFPLSPEFSLFVAGCSKLIFVIYVEMSFGVEVWWSSFPPTLKEVLVRIIDVRVIPLPLCVSTRVHPSLDHMIGRHVVLYKY